MPPNMRLKIRYMGNFDTLYGCFILSNVDIHLRYLRASSNFPLATPKMCLFQQRSGDVFPPRMPFVLQYVFPPDSQWIRTVAMDRKTPESTLPRTALAQLLDGFPTYKLQLQEDAVTVIRDIEKMLRCVAVYYVLKISIYLHAFFPDHLILWMTSDLPLSSSSSII
jgi:hypothetical protein